MLFVKTKAYTKFDWILTAASALIALNLFVLLKHQLTNTNQSNLMIYVVALCLAQVIYRLTLYFVISKRSAMAASLVSTILVSAALVLVLLATGGFGSPYYPLWLLLILVVGIYRPAVPFVLLTFTSLFFINFSLSADFNSALLPNTITALIASYMIAALGFWLWHSRHTRDANQSGAPTLSQKLSQEQLKSEILLHHIGEGVLVADLQSRVQLLNPAGQQITGWPEAEAKGIDSRIVMPLTDEHEESLLGDKDPFSDVIRKRQTLMREDVIVNSRSQRKLPLSLLISPIFDNNGELTGTIAVFRDITQAKASERQRNEFISTASHEMRTPVAAVEGFIALALNPKVARVDDKARTYLAKAQGSIQHLGQLFQDLLSTTRIEEGKLPSHPVPIEVVSLINQIIDELRLKAQSKGLGLKLKTGDQVGSIKSLHPLYYVYADPERIREVLTNLIDNGIKFTEKGAVSVTLDGDSSQITLGVEDTGPGIAPEDIPHLFQKFYRIDNSHTRDIGGTGLGLYICRAIIEMYQGRIWVESRLGVGSHFKFSLPRLDYAKAQKLLAATPLVANSQNLELKTASGGLVASPTDNRVK